MSKVYIITDLEGVAGVSRWAECRPAPRGDSRLFARSCRLLSREVAAAVKGARDGGADEVVVLDGHRGGGNLVPDELPVGAHYVLGTGKPRPVTALREDFDGLILLGYHAMSNSGGLLAHTMSEAEWDRYSLNGRETGEIGLMALAAGCYGVPLWLVTGGSTACAEAQSFAGPEAHVLQVKEDLSQESCLSLSPEEACVRIREQVRQTVTGPPPTVPYTVELPMRIELRFRKKAYADASGIDARHRTSDTEFALTVESALDYMPRSWG